MKTMDIVFDGPPGPVAGRFVEVENEDGASISIGAWIERGDGFWVLRIPTTDKLVRVLGKALKDASEHLDYCGYRDPCEREAAFAGGLDTKIEEAVSEYEEYIK